MNPAPSAGRLTRRLRWSSLLAAAALLPATAALGAGVPSPTSAREAAQHLVRDVGDARPDRVLSLDQLAATASSPDGPILPSSENADGIGPGSGLLLDESQLCTAGYLLEAAGTYYLSTAGHCLMKNADLAGAFAGPHANVVDKVEICVSGCRFNWAAGIDEFAGLRGTYVALEPAQGYHPVAYAHAVTDGGEDVGYDFGLIRLPAEVLPLLRPWMPQWGGPTAVQPPGLGLTDTAVHFGHGTYCCPAVGGVLTRTELDQGRVAQFNYGDEISFEALVGWASGGDSGSAVGRANPARLESKGVLGDTAVGILTHGIVVAGSFFGTVLTQGMQMAATHVPGLRLVTEDELGGGTTNSPPAALDDTATTARGTAVTVPVLANDTDPDGDPLQVTAVTAASHGTATRNSDGTVTYTPQAGHIGADTFTYTVSDGRGGTDSATVSVDVRNAAPDAVDDAATTRRNQPARIAVLANDRDPEGDPLTVTELTQPAHGTAEVGRDGTVTYRPERDYTGEDAFRYTISDGHGGTDTATVAVTVRPPGGGNRPAGL